MKFIDPTFYDFRFDRVCRLVPKRLDVIAGADNIDASTWYILKLIRPRTTRSVHMIISITS